MMPIKDVKETNPAIASRDMLENEKYPVAATSLQTLLGCRK